MSDFLTTLRSGRVFLMDGAMGTELQRAGIKQGEYYELWNLTHPERVRAIHQSYMGAGAEVLLTNTFQVVHAVLGWGPQTLPSPPPGGEKSRLLVLQWSAATLARSACGPQGFILADIGSFYNRSANEEFSDFSMLQMAVKVLGPVDGLLLETCSTPRALTAVRKANKVAGGTPVLLSLAYRRNDAGQIATLSGHAPEWFAERAQKNGVAALGVNCGRDIGMDEVIEIGRRYRAATDLPLFARPNAGTPRRVGKRLVYSHTPEQMAARLPELLEAGVHMVGGCCGTTPAHIAAFRPVIDAWNARRKTRRGRQEP